MRKPNGDLNIFHFSLFIKDGSEKLTAKNIFALFFFKFSGVYSNAL